MGRRKQARPGEKAEKCYREGGPFSVSNTEAGIEYNVTEHTPSSRLYQVSHLYSHAASVSPEADG